MDESRLNGTAYSCVCFCSEAIAAQQRLQAPNKAADYHTLIPRVNWRGFRLRLGFGSIKAIPSLKSTSWPQRPQQLPTLAMSEKIWNFSTRTEEAGPRYWLTGADVWLYG